MTASDAAVVLFIFTIATVSADKPMAASASLQHAAWAVHAGPQRVDAVLVALAGVALRVGEPLSEQVERLNQAKGDLERLAKEIGECWSLLQAQGESCFHRWETELAQLQTEPLGAFTAQRRQTVQGQFSHLRTGYGRTVRSFPPFLGPLHRIGVLLASDLTREGLAEFQSLRAQVVAGAPPLRAALAELETGFGALGFEFVLIAPACAPP